MKKEGAVKKKPFVKTEKKKAAGKTAKNEKAKTLVTSSKKAPDKKKEPAAGKKITGTAAGSVKKTVSKAGPAPSKPATRVKKAGK